METINPLPPKPLFITLEVTSLYPNIPYNDGIQSCKVIYDLRNIFEPPTECLDKLFTLVRTCNEFTFVGEHYLQINETVMGTEMPPFYPNTIMGKLARKKKHFNIFIQTAHAKLTHKNVVYV